MLRSTFSALRDRRYRAFFAGQVLSNTGTWMERAALASLVYGLSGHDEHWIALVASLTAVPALLLSIPAGAAVDRSSTRRIAILTQTALLVLAFDLALLVTFGWAEPWHLAAYSLVASAVFVIDAPARQSLIPRIVDRSDLTNAVALGAVTFNAARLIGAAAFGLVIRWTDWGEAGCFWLNAASFIFPVIVLLRIREDPRPPAPPVARGAILEGLRYAWTAPVTRASLLLALASSLFGFQVSHLVPVYAEKVWNTGKPGQGTLHAFIGGGALVGGLLLAAASRRIRRGVHVLRTSFLASVALACAACTPHFGFGCWMLAAVGFLLIQTHSGCNALLQSHVPESLRGRTVSLFTMSVLGAFPLGGLAAGVLARQFGAPSTTLVSAALLAITVALVAVTHRDLAKTA